MTGCVVTSCLSTPFYFKSWTLPGWSLLYMNPQFFGFFPSSFWNGLFSICLAVIVLSAGARMFLLFAHLLLLSMFASSTGYYPKVLLAPPARFSCFCRHFFWRSLITATHLLINHSSFALSKTMPALSEVISSVSVVSVVPLSGSVVMCHIVWVCRVLSGYHITPDFCNLSATYFEF